MLHGSRRSIPGDEHHFVIGEDDTPVTDDLGNWKIVSPPGGFLDRPKDLTQGATHRLMQTPSGETTATGFRKITSPLGSVVITASAMLAKVI